MKNLISFLIFFLFAFIGMWWYFSCNWCLGSKKTEPSIVQEQTDPAAEALARKAYEDSLALARGLFAKNTSGVDVFRYSENLRINNANGGVHIPDEILDFKEQIANYLGKQQDQELIILGYETHVEKSSGANLGLSRANFIKDILIKAGINGDRVITKPRLYDYDYNANGHYTGGIILNFNKIDQSRLKEIEKGITNKILYSDFGSKDFKPDATLANYALELKNYLGKYPDKKVILTGHTDNIGDEESNQWYGLTRANNVKKYLVSKGILITKLTALSKGESSPIAPNDTEESRAKNRRIEIIVN